MSSVTQIEGPVAATTVAVLMTCHNRQEKTRVCLASLGTQRLPTGISLGLWIVDDGSSDGTSEVIRELWPAAHLLNGNGDLFWCGGMRLAWEAAVPLRPHFLLLLNDDTELRAGALAGLWETWQASAGLGRRDTVVVGSCCDPLTGTHTYGGQRRLGRHPGRLVPVPPMAVPVGCDTFQANCVLIPRDVYDRIGGLTPFRHAIADTDYGYRAVKAGCRLVVSPGIVASCARSTDPQPWRDRGVPRLRRLAALCGPKGLPPVDWALFLRRHAGAEWPLYWLWTYIRAIVR